MKSLPIEARLSHAILPGLLRLGASSFDHVVLREDLVRFKVLMEWTGEMDDRSMFLQFVEIRALAYYRWEVGKGWFHHRLVGELFQRCFPRMLIFTCGTSKSTRGSFLSRVLNGRGGKTRWM
jgi:hypothetical protein